MNKKSRFINILKVIGAIFIFVIVVSILGTMNTPTLDVLNADAVSTRYLELPSGQYAGDTALGDITGKGSFYFDTGEVYQGSWNSNEISGAGKLTYTTGVYEGDFSDSARSGQGTFTWPDGSTYTGSWVSDKLSGEGKLSSNTIIYSGTFEDNEFTNGNITLTNETGTYKLSVENAVLTKNIEITFATGTIYTGEYLNTAISGSGTMTFPSIGNYVGSFSNGKRDGQGTFTWEDGTSYVGTWTEDSMNGEGTYNFDSSTYIKGTFINGTLNGTYTYHNSDGDYTTKWTNGRCTSIERSN
ncbi:hypothetical protein [Oscillibacter ruminantium]|uniref:hypothetical protein n=1 Tax=Oscillibacter ruminantium TaxID=1263547 RepID=UPI0002E6B343|nr:hypothetical protein [Oscillibacter ruminantium]